MCCVCVCVRACVRACMRACVRFYACMHVHMCVHACLFAHTYMLECVCDCVCACKWAVKVTAAVIFHLRSFVNSVQYTKLYFYVRGSHFTNISLLLVVVIIKRAQTENSKSCILL